jgi:hypothetical protein
MIWKQSTYQLFVIMISEGDHHDLCSKILVHRINLLGQAHYTPGRSISTCTSRAIDIGTPAGKAMFQMMSGFSDDAECGIMQSAYPRPRPDSGGIGLRIISGRSDGSVWVMLLQGP